MTIHDEHPTPVEAPAGAPEAPAPEAPSGAPPVAPAAGARSGAGQPSPAHDVELGGSGATEAAERAAPAEPGPPTGPRAAAPEGAVEAEPPEPGGDGEEASAVESEEASAVESEPRSETPARGDSVGGESLAAERDRYLALAQRTQADFENYRKRIARETQAAEARGVVRLAKELLPALDNLDRALLAAAEDDPLLDGIRLVQSDISAALARLGIESFSPAGEAFDPSEHEAMAQQPVEGAQSGTVIEVYQPGYRLNGSVLRPARVVVAA